MGAGPTTGADRETVLRWMDKNGKGYMAAATHFGLPVQRVKNWHVRRTHREPTVNPPESAKVADGARGESGRQHKAADAPSVARAGVPPQALSSQDRDQLRAGVRGALAYLAEPTKDEDGRPLRIDWKSRDAAARTLRNLLEVGAQVLAFDDATGSESSGGPSAEERVALDRVMLADDVRPGLSVVSGGKAAEKRA